MRFRIVLSALVLIWLARSAFCAGIDWKPYNEGMQQAREQNKKVFLHFRTDWCRFCSQMEQQTFSDASVIGFLTDHFVSIKVDGDREKDVGRAYKIVGYPDTRFLDGAGREVYKLPGMVAPDVLLFFLQYIQSESYQTMDPMEYYRSR